MRQIINPWLNLEGYNCFGCCATNPHGMRMQFYDADPSACDAYIYSVFSPTYDHQSWLNTLHGGLQATLLDEVCGWVVFAKLKTSGVTAKMEIRYKKAVSTVNGPVVLRARLIEERHRVTKIKGELWSAARPDSDYAHSENNADDETFLLEHFCLSAECECTYFSFDHRKALEMGYMEPLIENTDRSLRDLLVSPPKHDGLRNIRRF